MSGWELPTVAASPSRDPRRLGLMTGGVVVAYAIVLGAIRAGFIKVAGSGSDEIGPSNADLEALWLTLAFALPGLIAVIAAARRSGPLLVTAGVLCLGQAFIAFSGAALPFVVPGIYLIALGAGSPPTPHAGRAMLAGLGVVVLVVAAWVTSFGLTETRCWTATREPDGTLVYADVSTVDEVLLDETQVGAGCDGGSPTAAGLGLGILLAGAALALTTWGTRPSRIDPSAGDPGASGPSVPGPS